MIPRFIAALQQAGQQVTDEDVADILWLAMHMGAAEASSAEESAGPVGDDEAAEPEDGDPTGAADASGRTPAAQPTANLHLPSTGSSSGHAGMGGVWFRSPAATALPGTLALGRALRPFMRRVASRTRRRLDEPGTARRIAEHGIWLPVLKPVPARWLEVALVVEGSRSMDIWQQTARALQFLLERHGAFRDVRTWTLLYEEREGTASTVSLRSGLGTAAAHRAGRDPLELIDAGRRRLILLLSDCVSPAWHSGTIPRMLARWGQACPVTLVQALPQRMWTRTALRSGRRTRLRASFPGAPNACLQDEATASWEEAGGSNEQLFLPVVTLDALSIGAWAHAMTAAHDAWTAGYALGLAPDETVTGDKASGIPSAQAPPLVPEERLRRFRATASPTARKLATLLAAAPVSMPVIRLVQRTLLPESQQSHVAEVLLSGLFEEVPAGSAGGAAHDVNPDLIQYDFRPGVRDLLLDSLSRTQSLQVLSAISRYIGEHAGSGIDFPALLADPSSAEGTASAATSRPFAAIGAMVLRRLGGSYAALAERLESALASQSEPLAPARQGGPQHEASASGHAHEPTTGKSPDAAGRSAPQDIGHNVTNDVPAQERTPTESGKRNARGERAQAPAPPAAPPATMRVFVSATHADMRAYRPVVIATLRDLGLVPVDMEGAIAKPAPYPTLSLLAGADISLGIVAWRYGSIPLGQLYSTTEVEYQTAVAQGLPRLIFLADPSTDADQGDYALFPASVRDVEHRRQLDAFRSRLEREQTVQYFTTPEDLSRKIAYVLQPFLKEHGEQHGSSDLRRDSRHPPRTLPPRTAGFVGREGDVQWLLSILRFGPTPKHAIAVTGPAGAGKSALAAEVVHRLAADPQAFSGGIVTIRCDGRVGHPGLAWIYDQLMAAWGVPLPSFELEGLPLEEGEVRVREHALRDWLERSGSRGEALILLDGVEPELPVDELSDALAATLGATGLCVLVTTRGEPAPRYFITRHLSPLDVEEALALLASRFRQYGGAWDAPRMEHGARALLEAVGGLARDIEMAAAEAAQKGLSFAELAIQWEERLGAKTRPRPSIRRRVFVSYSPADERFGRRLVEDVRAAGAEVWSDVSDLEAISYARRIVEALHDADWVLVVLTPSVLASQWIRSEVNAVLRRRQEGHAGGIIPVLAEPCPPEMIPPLLASLQRFDATRDYESALAGILRAIGLESEGNLTSMTPEEFMRLVERREVITTMKLVDALVPVVPTPLEITVVDSQFRYCSFSAVRFADSSRFITTSFIMCRMDGIVARKALFVECRFTGTDLGGADFRESDFTRTLFEGGRFGERTDFLRATFTHAKVQEVDGQEVIFTQANFTEVELSHVRLQSCRFERAALTRASLWRSDFSGSDFSGASLKEADLNGTSFVNCDLEDANFEGARNIERADFRGSNWRMAKFDPLVQKTLEERYAYAATEATSPAAMSRHMDDEGVAQEEAEEKAQPETATAAGEPAQPADGSSRKVRLRRMYGRLRKARSEPVLCRSFTRCAEELTAAGYVQVFLRGRGGDAGGNLVVHATSVDRTKYPHGGLYRAPSQRGIIGRAMRTARTEVVNDVRLDPDYIAAEPGTRSELVLPILHPATGDVLGVVNLESLEIGAFSASIVEDVQALVTVLAARLAKLADTRPPTSP